MIIIGVDDMKKKGIIICVVALLVIVVGAVLLLVPKKGDNASDSIITLDINPSIELTVRKEIVKSVRALNDDAKDYVNGLEGKSLNESFDLIIKTAKDHNLAEDGKITIIMGTEDNANSKQFEDLLQSACSKNEVNGNIIVPVITEEAKQEAQKHGVSPAKAAYIMETVKENENLTFEEMIDKPSEEIYEMKETGKYCDKDYSLVGDYCEKVIKEEKPKEGKTCPEGYEDIKDSCYKTYATKQEAYCKDGLTLKDGKCTGNAKTDATAKCSTGTYNSKTKKCEELTYVSDGTKTCRGELDLLLDNGRCASVHPGAHSYGDDPSPFDEATECCCGDTFKDGWCYSLPNGNYDASVTCPSGSSYAKGDKGSACYKTATSEPTYSCESGKLEGTKCVGEVTKKPEYKTACDEGYTLKDKKCVDYNDNKGYIVGYVCEDDARLENNICKYYEQVAPKVK
jgi:hemerythrin superfamily protein